MLLLVVVFASCTDRGTTDYIISKVSGGTNLIISNIATETDTIYVVRHGNTTALITNNIDSIPWGEIKKQFEK